MNQEPMPSRSERERLQRQAQVQVPGPAERVAETLVDGARFASASVVQAAGGALDTVRRRASELAEDVRRRAEQAVGIAMQRFVDQAETIGVGPVPVTDYAHQHARSMHTMQATAVGVGRSKAASAGPPPRAPSQRRGKAATDEDSVIVKDTDQHLGPEEDTLWNAEQTFEHAPSSTAAADAAQGLDGLTRSEAKGRPEEEVWKNQAGPGQSAQRQYTEGKTFEKAAKQRDEGDAKNAAKDRDESSRSYELPAEKHH